MNRGAPSSEQVCWPGGTRAEGAETSIGYDCAFGLTHRYDFTTEPRRYTCEPVCNSDSDCRRGEQCSDGTCAVPCEGTGSVPCVAPDRCVQQFCVNVRRFERIDCNHDGVVGPGDPDCRPAFVCDDTAIGGCGFPEPGTE